MILYIMNDFQVQKCWIDYSWIDSEMIADAMSFLSPREDGNLLNFRAEKWMLEEKHMLSIMRVLDEISSKLEWHYSPHDGDVYFQVHVTPRRFPPS